MSTSTGENRPAYMKKYKQGYAKKKRQVNISLDREAYKTLEQKAQAEDIKTSALAKRYVLDALGDRKGATLQVPKLNEKTAQELTRLMRTMANNYNQVAHHLNLSAKLDGYTPRMDPELAISEMYKQLQTLEQKVTAMLTQRSSYDH